MGDRHRYESTTPMIDAQVEPRKRTNYRQRNLHSEVMVPLAWTLIGPPVYGSRSAVCRSWIQASSWKASRSLQAWT
jgi:hypothetical protein